MCLDSVDYEVAPSFVLIILNNDLALALNRELRLIE